MDFYGFYTGTEFEAYRYLGAHPCQGGVVFRTFAPKATAIALISDLTDWKEIPLHKIYDGNFWEVTLPDAAPGTMYKYRIYNGDKFTEHCDPYGFGMEKRPAFASIVRDLDSYRFNDRAWMSSRTDCRKGPLNIYELHLGSFRKPEDKLQDSWYTYSEMADILLPYLKQHGYNYIELMPLAEYPSDESWGYQGTGFFSPTSRYGTAEQLMEFVDACHAQNVGVIMDFVPVHFAVDGYGLARYDGTALYEFPDAHAGISEWGSCNFMHSRGEVRSFLQSAANYWLSEYHIDGLRMDAISRILYWQGDENRGANHEGIRFLKDMNAGLKQRHPTVLLAAEDSTTYVGVTKPVKEGGLGFDYKWDMGWMNDTLNYYRLNPAWRTGSYHKLTFSMMYYYNDNFLLPLSHDEVVHGKATIMQKMSGQYEQKFPQARNLYMYMMAHPGKKLNFMGNELGQLREWDEKRGQDWLLLTYPAHDAFRNFISVLNNLYLSHPAFYEKDYDRTGFQWLDCHQESRCIYALQRFGGKEEILAIFNMVDATHYNYKVELPGSTGLEMLLASDEDTYGGPTHYTWRVVTGKDGVYDLTLSPFAAVYYLVKRPPAPAKPAKAPIEGKAEEKTAAKAEKPAAKAAGKPAKK